MEPAAGATRDQTSLIRLLLSLQSGSGGFRSTVHSDLGSIDDENGFVTALVLRELEPLAGLPALIDPCRRALDFVARCEAPSRTGFFAFWPRSRWPSWCPQVPEDLDCTATMASELLHYGRIDLARARDIAQSALIPYRLNELPAEPDKPWIRPGAFLTWHHPLPFVHLMDCTVNANVAGFFAQIGLQHQAGYDDACRMIADGIHSAAGSGERLEGLSPYYPEPAELVRALQNAVRRGAAELFPCLEELRRIHGADTANHRAATLFSMADRRTRWSSEAVWAARELSEMSPRSLI